MSPLSWRALRNGPESVHELQHMGFSHIQTDLLGSWLADQREKHKAPCSLEGVVRPVPFKAVGPLSTGALCALCAPGKGGGPAVSRPPGLEEDVPGPAPMNPTTGLWEFSVPGLCWCPEYAQEAVLSESTLIASWGQSSGALLDMLLLLHGENGGKGSTVRDGDQGSCHANKERPAIHPDVPGLQR